MKNKKIWVLWKKENGTKVPYQPNGRKASSTDRSTWSTYAEVAAVKDQFSGLGFMFDGSTLGIDLDHVLDTGTLSPEIEAFVTACHSYTEISPSGTGLHIVFQLTEPLELEANKHKNEDGTSYECYTKARFFTYTGNKYVSHKTRTIDAVEAVQLLQQLGYPWGYTPDGSYTGTHGVSTLEDSAVLRKMFSSKNGRKIEELYNGNTNDYNNDDSSADLALCSHLAFWTQCDSEQMERLWLCSPLGQRKKTQNRLDYRTRTIKAAIANCREVYTPPVAVSIATNLLDTEEDISIPAASTAEVRTAKKPAEAKVPATSTNFSKWQDIEKEIDKVRVKLITEEDEKERKSLIARERTLIKMLIEQYHNKLSVHHPFILYERTEEKVFWDYNRETGVYDELAYVEVRNRVIKMLVKQELEAYATDKNVKDIITRYRGVYQDQGIAYDDFDKDNDLFHVKNGWLNVVTLELQPHTPAILSRRVSNVEYIADAICPVYDKFLDTDIQLPADAVRVIDQFSGLTLTRDIKHEKMLTIIGKPGSGKSTLLNVWSYVLGDLTVQKSLTDLTGDRARFGGADFVGRNLCWFDEVDVKRNEAGSRLLKLITGTHHDIERKGINTTSYAENYLKCVLTANRLPLSVEQGLYRRMILIYFPRSFNSEGIQDIDILNAMKAEASGILNRMLKGLQDLRKMRTFTMIAGQDNAIEEYKTQSDTVAEFLDTFFVPSNDDAIPSKQLFEAYKSFSDDRFVNTPQRFGQMLSAQPLNAFSLTQARTKTDRVWKGLRLKSEYVFKHNDRTDLDEIHNAFTIHEDF